MLENFLNYDFPGYLEDYVKTGRVEDLIISLDAEVLVEGGMQNTPEHSETFRNTFREKYGVATHSLVVPGHYPGQKNHFGPHCDPGMRATNREIEELQISQLKGRDPKNIVGHSLGGLHVVNMLANPEIAGFFKAAVLLAPATPYGYPGVTPEFKKRAGKQYAKVAFQRMMAFIRLGKVQSFELDTEIAKWALFDDSVLAEIQKRLIDARVPEPSRRIFEYAFSKILFFKWILLMRWRIGKTILKNIKVPVYCFTGSDDPMVDVRGVRQMMDDIPKGHITILDGKRHALPEDPEVIELVFNCLKENGHLSF